MFVMSSVPAVMAVMRRGFGTCRGVLVMTMIVHVCLPIGLG
jgi:hypothetical protein